MLEWTLIAKARDVYYFFDILNCDYRLKLIKIIINEFRKFTTLTLLNSTVNLANAILEWTNIVFRNKSHRRNIKIEH
jgi:hypothetical protein